MSAVVVESCVCSIPPDLFHLYLFSFFGYLFSLARIENGFSIPKPRAYFAYLFVWFLRNLGKERENFELFRTPIRGEFSIKLD